MNLLQVLTKNISLEVIRVNSYKNYRGKTKFITTHEGVKFYEEKFFKKTAKILENNYGLCELDISKLEYGKCDYVKHYDQDDLIDLAMKECQQILERNKAIVAKKKSEEEVREIIHSGRKPINEEELKAIKKSAFTLLKYARIIIWGKSSFNLLPIYLYKKILVSAAATFPNLQSEQANAVIEYAVDKKTIGKTKEQFLENTIFSFFKESNSRQKATYSKENLEEVIAEKSRNFRFA